MESAAEAYRTFLESLSITITEREAAFVTKAATEPVQEEVALSTLAACRVVASALDRHSENLRASSDAAVSHAAALTQATRMLGWATVVLAVAAVATAIAAIASL